MPTRSNPIRRACCLISAANLVHSMQSHERTKRRGKHEEFNLRFVFPLTVLTLFVPFVALLLSPRQPFAQAVEFFLEIDAGDR